MNNNNAQDAINEARKIGNSASNAATNVGKEFKAGVRQVGSAIRDAGSSVGDDLTEAAQEAYDAVIASGREGAKQLQKNVKQSPMMAVGIAFGVGMLTSALLCKR